MAGMVSQAGRLLCAMAAALPVLAAAGAEPAAASGLANGDFEAGSVSWRPYEAAVPQTALAGCSDRPHGGRQALRLETPGKSRLEGATVALAVQPDHSYRVDVWLRGGGTLMLAVLKRQGWVYGPALTPSAEWTRHRLRFLADAPTASLSILTTGAAAQAVTVFVDDVTLCEEPVAEAPAAAVAPFRIEAEEYRAAATFGSVVADPAASGGGYVTARRYYWLAYNVPLVPQTAQPFFLYLRARAESETQGRVTLLRALPDQPHEVLGSVPVPPSASWEWVRSGPHSYRLGKSFCVAAGTAKADEAVALDAIVISTDGALTGKELTMGAGAQ